jgi:hypothetical protein
MRIRALGLLLLALSGACLAQGGTEARMRDLEAELSRVRQEQQAVYQQFQILQALQRNEGLEADPTSPLYVQQGEIPNYDEAVRAKQERQERLRSYSEEMRRLSDRLMALENQSAPLIRVFI